MGTGRVCKCPRLTVANSTPFSCRSLTNEWGSAGLRNLHANNCWFRLCHLRVRMSQPEAAETVSRVKQIHDKTISLERWERVPFPTPLDLYFDYVHTIDQDVGISTLSKWSDVDGNWTPPALEVLPIYVKLLVFLLSPCDGSLFPQFLILKMIKSQIENANVRDDSI
ncbi:hypothetical protein PENCOP_c002G01825 [Penicillium coprophilum]|uniref:Uncharacterized protein n=1 Tax=Penicillium coprophilum TaxID=36646 RepID=A0A1V6V1V0_9EURO|nr:hypothetical protein PENCOP_c002G01825 [Penicillium coprophilum]